MPGKGVGTGSHVASIVPTRACSRSQICSTRGYTVSKGTCSSPRASSVCASALLV